MSRLNELSRRERQIMDVLFTENEATVNQVRDRLPDPPGATSIRTFLHILLEKGLVTRRKTGREYVYRPRPRRKRTGQSALRQVIDTFFDGSLTDALGAHLADRQSELSDEELRRLRELIDEQREDRR